MTINATPKPACSQSSIAGEDTDLHTECACHHSDHRCHDGKFADLSSEHGGNQGIDKATNQLDFKLTFLRMTHATWPSGRKPFAFSFHLPFVFLLSLPVKPFSFLQPWACLSPWPALCG